MKSAAPTINIRYFLVSLTISFCIGSFFYLLVLQLPIISKSRLLFSLLFSLAIILPIYKTCGQVYKKSGGKHKSIVLFASFVGLFIANAFFYYPRISYLFYGQHKLEVVIEKEDVRDTQIDITAFFTELKSESYSQFQISEGKWERNGSVFSIDGSRPTRLTWKGWTGSETTIKFRKNPKAGSITLIWDGIPQLVDLAGDQNEPLSIVQRFAPPLWGKILLWLLSTLVVSYFISLLVWLDGKVGVYKVIPTALQLERGKIQTIISIIIVIIIFISALSVFLPINPNRIVHDRDGGAFIYIGQQVLRGKVPYLDLWDHKGPLIYYINAVGLSLAMGSEWGVWFLQILWLFFTALLAYKVLSRLTGAIPALISTFLLSIFLAKPLGGGNYTEEYALLPLLLSWFGFQKFIFENRYKWLLLVGFSTGLALLLRPNLISGQIGISAVVLFLAWKNKNVKPLYTIFIGLVFILVPVILYFYLTGALYEMFSAFYLFNRYHHIGGSFDAFAYIYKGLESYKPFFGIIILSFVFVALYFLRSSSQETHKYFVQAFFWGFPLEIWLSNFAPFQYKHYYILWAAYFSVFSAFLFAWLLSVIYLLLNKFFRRISQLHFAISLLIFFSLFFLGRVSTSFSPDVFSPKDNPEKEFLTEIKPYSDCCAYLLVWGAEAQINFALDKESPSRYFYQYPLFSDSYATPEMISEFVHDVTVKKPLIIDTSATNVKAYPIDRIPSNFTGQTTERLEPFLSYVAKNYSPIHELSNGWIIYSPKP